MRVEYVPGVISKFHGGRGRGRVRVRVSQYKLTYGMKDTISYLFVVYIPSKYIVKKSYIHISFVLNGS
jgi:hypothetical protein